MRIVLDTNVFISGVFFSGPPYEILKAWRENAVQVVMSPEIFDEYQRVGRVLAVEFPGVDLGEILELLLVHAELILAPALPGTVCDDPDDDKFLACAMAGECDVVVSGDRHLLRATGYGGVRVLSPREFLEVHLGR